jgi:hypothetical protein
LRILQFNSDFDSHTVELRDYCTDEVVKTFSVDLKEQNLGISEDFGITIRNHFNNPGKSRVYFNVGTPPIPLSTGDTFTIINNPDGFDGSYAIIDVVNDALLGYQYLVINRNYDIAAANTSGTGRFVSDTADFNVYESTFTFIDVPNGQFYVRLRAFSDNERIALSEPIDLRSEHSKTNLIEYRNTDNAFGLTWTTGYIGAIRVESIFFKRLPGGIRSTSRNSDYSLVKINAKKTRITLFETFMLPPYLHEKLSVIFDCDYFAINGVQHQSSDAYDDPAYVDRFPLANSSIKLEQVEWFGKYNSDDISTVNEGGLITTETGFIKR